MQAAPLEDRPIGQQNHAGRDQQQSENTGEVHDSAARQWPGPMHIGGRASRRVPAQVRVPTPSAITPNASINALIAPCPCLRLPPRIDSRKPIDDAASNTTRVETKV